MHKSNLIRKYKSYPDTETKDAVFCPAESHPLSLVKTSRYYLLPIVQYLLLANMPQEASRVP